MTLLAINVAWAQSSQEQGSEAGLESSASAVILGVVRDASSPVADAKVTLRGNGVSIATVRTDLRGGYRFSAVDQGAYTLRAEKAGQGSATVDVVISATEKSRTVDLNLAFPRAVEPQSSSNQRPEFFDEPHFTVAGVADTSGLGGHGSDAIVRNREALADATAALSRPGSASSTSANAAMEERLREAVKHQPDDFQVNHRLGKLLLDNAKAQEGIPYLERAYRLNAGDFENAYDLALAYTGAADYAHARQELHALLDRPQMTARDAAQLHHLLGNLHERAGDPLAAVREYQRAAELNPSEPNLFDWGTELLTHHAAEPAIEVFTGGNRLFPRSVRMLAALGAARYSVGDYDDAVKSLCAASDLNPDDPDPYLFMGKMQATEIVQSPEIAARLARFAALRPDNALANFYFAASLWQRRKSPDDEVVNQVKAVLEKSIRLDPKLGPAYLQLGVVYAEERNLPKAISAYQQAILATPDLEEAHYRLAQLCRQTGDRAGAQVELQFYEQISREKATEVERQRRETQQFVYQLHDPQPAAPPR